MRRTVALCTMVALSGCGTLQSKFDDATTAETKAGPDWPDCSAATDDCRQRIFRTTIAYCQRLQGDYQSDSLFNTRTSLFLGALGMLSGGVLSPIASGSAKTAWSGLSGVINGVQTNFQASFGALQEANRRAKISGYLDAFKTEYMAETSPAHPYELSVYYAGKCSTAGAVADQETLSALASKAVATPSSPTVLTCKSEAGAGGSTTMTCTSSSDKPKAAP